MNPLGMALLGGGMSLLSGHQANRAASRERSFWRRQLRARQQSPEAEMMRALLGDTQEAIQTFAPAMRRQMERSGASRAQMMRKRIADSLARSGATQASAIGMQGLRGVATDIENQRMRGELGIMEAEQGLRGRAMGMAQSLGNFLYPSAGQSAQALGATQGTYWDPLQDALMGGMLGYGMSKYFGDDSISGDYGGLSVPWKPTPVNAPVTGSSGFDLMPWF